MENPAFSVVIPTHNRASLLPRCLDSVFAQTFAPEQVLVIDDASTDDTEAVVQKYFPKVEYIKLEKKTNGAYARNVGIQQATGNIIAFLDSDDYWSIRKLSVLAERISRTARPESTVYFHLPTVVDGSGRNLPWANNFAPFSPGTSVADFLLLKNGVMQTSCLAVPKIVLENCSFNPSLEKHQDLDLCLRLASLKPTLDFAFIPEPLTFWVQSNQERVSNANVQHSINWAKSFKFPSTVHEGNFYARFIESQLLRESFNLAAILSLASRLLLGQINFTQFLSFSSEFKLGRKIKLWLKASQ